MDRKGDILKKVLEASGYAAGQGEEKAELDTLNRHLLLAVSPIAKARAGLEFVSSFFTNKDQVRLTLMNVLPAQGVVWDEEKDFESLELMESRTEAGERKAHKVLDDAKRGFTAAGFPAGNIEIKITPSQMSKGHHIVREGRSGQYDAVVLGRRTQMKIEELMDKSVSRELLESLSDRISFPFWICRPPEHGRRNVLLCVDDSAPSERMADHVGFILADEPGQDVTVLHVHDSGKRTLAESEATMAKAVNIMTTAGMPEDRITRHILHASNPARSILQEIHAGKYAAVAIGSAGSDRGLLDKLLVGSVARKIFKELRGASLWVCF